RAALAALASIRGAQAAPDSQPLSTPPVGLSPAPAPKFASDGPSALPDLKEAPLALQSVEGKKAPEPAGAPQLWQTIPARGISLHEIASEDANDDGQTHRHAEPAQLPDITARPLERSTETTSAATTARPKVASKTTSAPLPLSNNSPLNLESQSGDSKRGS